MRIDGLFDAKVPAIVLAAVTTRRTNRSVLKEVFMHRETKDSRTFSIIGAAMRVHQELGHGFLEAVYQEALGLEMAALKIPLASQPRIRIHYRGVPLEHFYVADFICFDEIIVELKALDKITGTEEAQLLNYLKATRKRTGLILNFGSKSLEWKRMVV